MSKKADKTIRGTADAWDDRTLGADEQYAVVSDLIDQDALNESMELQMISIRIQKGLLEDLKYIAQINGLGYQPLIKQALRRFAECEKKRIIREMATQIQAEECADGEHCPPTKRAAG